MIEDALFGREKAEKKDSRERQHSRDKRYILNSHFAPQIHDPDNKFYKINIKLHYYHNN